MVAGNDTDIGGEIRVCLRVQDRRVVAVDCISSRPSDSTRMFVGKPLATVTRSIGNIYSLCGRAQTIAALLAIEHALHIPVPPQLRAARDLLRLSEMLSQTAMRLCLHWPRALGLSIQPALVRECLAAEQKFEAQIMTGEGWKTPGTCLSAPDTVAAGAVLDALTTSVDTLVNGPLPIALRTALKVHGLLGFGALPEGVEPELGALRRNGDHPAVAETRAAYGTGLATRLQAALADLCLITSLMQDALSGVTPVAAQKITNASGEGTALLETARGRLEHQVTIRDGHITRYRINAPTEINFRTDGPVAAGLMGAEATDIPALTCAAGLHILAIDPCVMAHVEVTDA